MEQRSTSKSIRSDDPIVGVVGAPHGVRGEVKVRPRTDVADRFRKGSRLLCDGIGELVIASVRGVADVPIVRFEGHSTRTDAERIRGRTLRVSRAEARRAAKNGYLWADLLGLRAETPEGKALGIVSEVLRIRSRAWPNLRIIELGDALLGRNGAIVSAVSRATADSASA